MNLYTPLTEFVAWCREHISGDEKGEAQLFLDHLFRAFGHAGLREAGATCEDRVKKDGGGAPPSPTCCNSCSTLIVR